MCVCIIDVWQLYRTQFEKNECEGLLVIQLVHGMDSGN